MDQGLGGVEALLVVSNQAAPADHPAESPLHHPAPRKTTKPLWIAAPDDPDDEVEESRLVHQPRVVIAAHLGEGAFAVWLSGTSPSGLACRPAAVQHQHHVMDGAEQQAPHEAEPRLDGLPWPKVDRQHPPAIARARQLADRLHHLAQVYRWFPAPPGSGISGATCAHSSVRSNGPRFILRAISAIWRRGSRLHIPSLNHHNRAAPTHLKRSKCGNMDARTQHIPG